MSADRADTSQANSVDRLSGLCRLWGTVKYFHPYLLSRSIDWDRALIETIPLVRDASTPAEYRAAIAHLLAFLDDPCTRLAEEAPPSAAIQVAEQVRTESSSVRWTDDEIAILDLSSYDRFTGAEGAERLRDLARQTERAPARVFDLRPIGPPDYSAQYRFGMTFFNLLPSFLEEPLQASSSRHRMHSGHPSGFGGDIYYSALVTALASVLPARAEQGTERFMVFLVNERSIAPWNVLGGLQATRRGAVVWEGAMSCEPMVDRHPVALPDEVSVHVRLVETINPDGTVGFVPDRRVDPSSSGDPGLDAALEIARERPEPQRSEAVPPGLPGLPLDQPYDEMDPPSEEYRLLGLFRYWNAIHYFFPYMDLLDRSWDDVLPELIPRFRAAGDARSYVLAAAEMVTRIQDTHGGVVGRMVDRELGSHHPPIFLRSVEGETVVTEILDSATLEGVPLRPGDVVLAVDGNDIVAVRERLARICAASTPQALRWKVDAAILRGGEDAQVVLTVRGGEGNVREVPLRRSLSGVAQYALASQSRSGRPVFAVLPEGVGYIDLTRLIPSQVEDAFAAIKDTAAVIMDMRGYPNNVFHVLGGYLAGSRAVAARFRHAELHGPDPLWRSEALGSQIVEPGPHEPYAGKVIVLINENAISQSEHTCLFLEAAADVTFIGSSTSGANGNVTSVVLPGGIRANFTGLEVQHGDGRQLQRIGIEPHIHVEPTIEGIRQGRDEVLEAAVGFAGGLPG